MKRAARAVAVCALSTAAPGVEAVAATQDLLNIDRINPVEAAEADRQAEEAQPVVRTEDTPLRGMHHRAHHHHRHHHHARQTIAQHETTVINLHKGASPRALQHEVEKLAVRVDKLATTDESQAAEVAGALEDIEADLSTRAGNDAGLSDEIRAVRADLCAKQGFRSTERKDCEVFMQKACSPDKVQQETPTALFDICRHFFIAEARVVGAPSPARAEEADGDSGLPAFDGPAPAPAGMQAPAAAPENQIDTKWFSKIDRHLPEQGVVGDLVTHENTVTQTSDWQREFGPRSGHRSYREICRRYPENRWCKLHMSYSGDDIGAGWRRRNSATVKAHGDDDDDDDRRQSSQQLDDRQQRDDRQNGAGARGAGLLATSLAVLLAVCRP